MRLIFIFLLLSFSLKSQKTITDLENMIDRSNSFLSSNLDSAMFYMKKAYDLNDRIGNDYYRARCLYNFGNINYKKGYLRKARYFTKQALFFANKSKNEKILYRAENLLGLMEYDNAEYDKSIMHFQNALKKISETDFDDYYATIYFNLGNLTITKQDTLNALVYYDLARKHALLSKDTLTELITYNSIALIEIDKDRNKAEKYFKKALILSKKINEYSETFNIHINLSNLYNKKRNFEKSIIHLRDAEVLIDKIGNKSLYFYINFNYGGLYEKKNYQKAIEFYHKAEGIYDLGGIPIEQKISLLKSISNTYAKSENFEKANEYQDHYYKLKDSLFTIEREKDYNHLLAKFEIEKKNNQILQLTKQKEIESLNASKLLIVTLLLGAIVIAIFFIFLQRQKSQKKIKEKEEKINISKGILEGQNEERNRLAKELHDGVAGSLVGINLMLEHENDVQKTGTIIEIQKNINNLYEEIRDISHDLRRGVTENTNLQRMIHNLASSYERTKKFKSNLLFFPDSIFSDVNFNFKMDIYRIFQEIYTNIYKHSQAKNIEISCTQNSDHINIIIEDDGKGFSDNYTEGIGLKNIKERLNKYQGEMIMENSNQGSVIILNMPIK